MLASVTSSTLTPLSHRLSASHCPSSPPPLLLLRFAPPTPCPVLRTPVVSVRALVLRKCRLPHPHVPQPVFDHLGKWIFLRETPVCSAVAVRKLLRWYTSLPSEGLTV
eukprot:RCo014990